MKSLIVIALLALAGCATPQSPQEQVFAAKSAHAVALRAAVTYRELPPCSRAAQPCHEPAVVQALQKADRVADAALDSAEHVVRTPGFGQSVITSTVTAAQAALAAFVSITDTLRR